MSKKETFAKQGTLPPTFLEKDLSYYLRTLKNDFSEKAEPQALKLTPSASHKNVVILLTSNILGRSDEKLGKMLMSKFLMALSQNRIKPKALILMNEAVYLAKKESETVPFLTSLIEQEVGILICEESLKEKKLEKEIRIGNNVNMHTICDNLLTAWKVVTI
ncbi:MAG: hypothetical protein ABIH00_07180 [Armatimonadota bacterium]